MITGLLLLVGLLFHPVEPCRVIDTRVASFVNMEIPEGGYVAFIVSGDSSRVGLKGRGVSEPIAFSFADQGGEAGGCGIPRDAKAAVFNVTVLPRADRGPGHLRVWRHHVLYYIAFGGAAALTPPPRASNVNWGSDQPVANSLAIVRLCVEADAPFNDCNEDIVVRATGAPTHLIVDVQGYYTEPVRKKKRE